MTADLTYTAPADQDANITASTVSNVTMAARQILFPFEIDLSADILATDLVAGDRLSLTITNNSSSRSPFTRTSTTSNPRSLSTQKLSSTSTRSIFHRL